MSSSFTLPVVDAAKGIGADEAAEPVAEGGARWEIVALVNDDPG